MSRQRRARVEGAPKTPREIQKNAVQTHAVMMDKTRFPTFEVAAKWIEAQGFSLRKHEDRRDFFVFIQMERELFKQESLNTIKLSDGVEAVVGQLNDGQVPVIAGQDPVKPEEQNAEGEIKIDLEDDSAFDALMEVLGNGYELLTEGQVETLRTGLKDEFKDDLRALAEAIDEALPLIERMDLATLNDAQADIHSKVLESLGKLEELLPMVVRKKEGIEPAGKFHGLDLKPTEAVIAEVQKGLEWKKTLKRGGTPKQEKLAKKLVTGEALTVEEVQKMADFHDKHSKNRGFNEDGSPVDGEIAFALHGGEAGVELAKNLLEAFDTAEKRESDLRREKVAKALGQAGDVFQLFHGSSFENLALVLKCAVVSMGRFLDGVDTAPVVVEKKVEQKLVEKTKFSAKVTKSTDEEQRTVLGIVLEPDVADLHGDTMDEETIRKTAHLYMEQFQNIKLMHETPVNDKIKVVESYLAPVDFTLETSDGSIMKIKKGTWLLKVRIADNNIWSDVKSGNLTGFSMGGIAMVHDLREEKEQ